jgi:hypothetical protein
LNILSESERAALLQSLTEAPDEVLIDAVRQRKDWMSGVRSSFKEVQGFIGMKVIEAPVLKSAPEPKVNDTKPVPDSPRPNKSPGHSSISKIGTKTKDEIIAVLKAGRQPNHDKYGEHLKLLWEREIVLYDGKEYYLSK